MFNKAGRVGVRKDQVDAYGRVKANENLKANGKNFIFAYDEETEQYGYKLTENDVFHPFDGSNSIFTILKKFKVWYISDNTEDTIAVSSTSSGEPILVSRTSNESLNIVRAYNQAADVYTKISFIALSSDESALDTITWVGDANIVRTLVIDNKTYYYKKLPYGDTVVINDDVIESDGDQYVNEILYSSDTVQYTVRYSIAKAIILSSN